MNEIIANGSIGLLMILLQEENPLWIVTLLRLALAFAATAGVAWFIGFVVHQLKEWFWK